MSRKADAPALLDREFHLIRAQILSLAASLDRLERASSSSPEAEADERVRLIRDSISILPAPGPDRAERVQLHFSDPYADDWRSRLGVPTL